REDRLLSEELGDAEEPQPVEQRRDVPSRDAERRALVEDLPELAALPLDPRALEGPHLALELVVHAGALPEVVVVEAPDRVERRVLLLPEDLGRRRALADHVVRAERVLEPDAIEVLLVSQHALAGVVR